MVKSQVILRSDFLFPSQHKNCRSRVYPLKRLMPEKASQPNAGFFTLNT